MNISDYLKPQNILFLDSKDKYTTLESMVQTASLSGDVADPKEFEKMIKSREAIVSTGIGLGVAVPHAKLETLDHFFIICAILSHDVEWDAIDQHPVRLVFMIGGPAREHTSYLKILSKLVLLAKNSTRREKFLAAKSPNEVLDIIDSM